MANSERGEVSITVGAEELVFLINLNAMAKLETALDGESFVYFLKRISKGEYSAADVLTLLKSSLLSQNKTHFEAIDELPISAALKLVKELISLTFAASSSAQQNAKKNS